MEEIYLLFVSCFISALQFISDIGESVLLPKSEEALQL